MAKIKHQADTFSDVLGLIRSAEVTFRTAWDLGWTVAPSLTDE